MTDIHIKRGNLHTGKTPYEDEGRYGVMLLEAKQHQRLPANLQKLKDAQRALPQNSQKDPSPPIPWSWLSGLQNCEAVYLCCLSRSVCGTLLQQTNKGRNINMKSNKKK